MNFYAQATAEFLSGLDESTYEEAYDNLSNHVHEGEELSDEIMFWEPFENYEPEDVLELIDNLAGTLERMYNAGRDSVLHQEIKL